MVLKLNKAAYQKLIDEDIAAVRASNCEALEREHIVDVLRHSVEMYYPTRDPDTQVEKTWLICQRSGNVPRTVVVLDDLDTALRLALELYDDVQVVRLVFGGHLWVDSGKEFLAIADALADAS
jgi:hypothetical protein